jgi:DnaJ-domain-containing protein 1
MTRDMRSPYRLLFLLWISLNSLVLFMEGVSCQTKSDNFYDLLEVPRQASKSEIKKAYRKLSK